MTWPCRAARALCDRPGRAGGADGATHAGAFDVAYLSNLPGFTVMAAADEAELMDMVRRLPPLTPGRSHSAIRAATE